MFMLEPGLFVGSSLVEMSPAAAARKVDILMQRGRHINGWYSMKLMGRLLSSLKVCAYLVTVADMQYFHGLKKKNLNEISLDICS